MACFIICIGFCVIYKSEILISQGLSIFSYDVRIFIVRLMVEFQTIPPIYRTRVNVSPMSPKLFLSYPHREEYREINLATLFLWLVLLKLLCNQLKIFVNLTFSQKVWLFVLFWFTGFAELRVLQVQLHCSKKEVTFWFCCGKNVKFLKSIICD